VRSAAGCTLCRRSHERASNSTGYKAWWPLLPKASLRGALNTNRPGGAGHFGGPLSPGRCDFLLCRYEYPGSSAFTVVFATVVVIGTHPEQPPKLVGDVAAQLIGHVLVALCHAQL
jgi:hypothetical protein